MILSRELLVKNLEDLENFAFEISNDITADSFLLISGDLGVGKTTLVQFICSKLGIKDRINSPTFNILQRYWIEEKNCFLNHFDFFRLKRGEDISFFDEFKINSINIIEWPEINPEFWSEEKKLFFLNIEFSSFGYRKITFKSF